MKISRVFFFTSIMLAVFMVAGCGRVALYQDLSEEDANEILVLLAENGIKCQKTKEVKQNVTSYAIEVREADMVKARSLLVNHNLPRRRELGLTGVYKEKGLIPTPDEQKARFLLALKGEIINSLEKIPDVIDADVVLNVPTRDEFANADIQQRQKPTASVVIKVKRSDESAESLTEPKIQQFVANSIEGMNPRDVAVIITYITGEEVVHKATDVKSMTVMPLEDGDSKEVSAVPGVKYELIGLTLDADSKDRLKIYLLAFFVILIVLSAALIIVIVQGSRMRRTLSALRGPAGQLPAVEGRILDEGPPELPEGPSEDEF